MRHVVASLAAAAVATAAASGNALRPLTCLRAFAECGWPFSSSSSSSMELSPSRSLTEISRRRSCRLRPPRGTRSGRCRKGVPLLQLQAGPDSYGPDEYYSRKAREEGVPARSYFKLEELDQRLKLFRPGQKVLDLGCWPGSWTLYAARRVGDKGRVLGIDFVEVTFPLPSNCQTRVEDANHFRTSSVPKLDVVLSDMAPKTMGDSETDHERSAALVELVMNLADTTLGLGGTMVAKLFDGAQTKDIMKQMKIRYETARIMRPKATRSQSPEIYVVGIGKKSANTETPATWRAPKPPTRPKQPMPNSFNGW
ncbi:unnamed protein product [Polarella glacialis]|uniref:rRNA methyltransferase 2, mitochondrial n=1 Tax=Polarella glacialis TaxID=89957 RepID=A0A813JPJ1_POLGL|nr:unnamed protein product [Polarella glacialis]CAE8680017.1 unnamed protein product [Polarella glacialis]